MGKDHTDSDELSERVIIPMTKAMVAEIADYRFEARCETKSEAIRRLIQAGLDAERKAKKP